MNRDGLTGQWKDELLPGLERWLRGRGASLDWVIARAVMVNLIAIQSRTGANKRSSDLRCCNTCILDVYDGGVANANTIPSIWLSMPLIRLRLSLSIIRLSFRFIAPVQGASVCASLAPSSPLYGRHLSRRKSQPRRPDLRGTREGTVRAGGHHHRALHFRSGSFTH